MLPGATLLLKAAGLNPSGATGPGTTGNVADFLGGNSSFDRIVSTVSDVVTAHLESEAFVPGNQMRLADVTAAEEWARAEARRRLEAHR